MRLHSSKTPRTPIIVPKRTEMGAPPGTISPPADAEKPRIELICYGADEVIEREVESVAELRDLVGKTEVSWINITGIGDSATFTELGQLFGYHHLALEDVVNLHQRPKIEDYDEYAYLVLRMPTCEDGMDLEQISVFLGANHVLTVQAKPGDCLEPVRKRIRRGRGRIRTQGADYLAYAITDAIIDRYFPIVEDFNARLDQLEDRVIPTPDERALGEIHNVRHDLSVLRRVVAATRDVVGPLSRGEIELKDEDTQLFFRDCYDHTAQLLDAIESCRELSSSLIDIHYSVVAHQMNEIMRILTLIATLFMPLSFVASLYGMNFDRHVSPWNMPELGWSLGYPFALAVMLAMFAGFLIFYRRRGWLGRVRHRRSGHTSEGR